MSFTVTFSYVDMMCREANSLTLPPLASLLTFHKQFPSTICLFFSPRVYIREKTRELFQGGSVVEHSPNTHESLGSAAAPRTYTNKYVWHRRDGLRAGIWLRKAEKT